MRFLFTLALSKLNLDCPRCLGLFLLTLESSEKFSVLRLFTSSYSSLNPVCLTRGVEEICSLTFAAGVVVSVWREGFLRVLNENGRGSYNCGVTFAVTETELSVCTSVVFNTLSVVSKLELDIKVGMLELLCASDKSTSVVAASGLFN